MNNLVVGIIGGFCAGVVVGFLVGDHIATKKHNAKVEELQNKYQEIVDTAVPGADPDEVVVYERELTENEVSDYARLIRNKQNEEAIAYSKQQGDNIDEPYFSEVENRGGVEILTADDISNHLAELQNINRNDKIMRGKMVEQIEEADWGNCGFDEQVYTFYRPDRVMVDRQTDLVVYDAVVLEETFDITWVADLSDAQEKTMTIQEMLVAWPREETVWLRDNEHMVDYEIDIVDVDYM